MIFIKLFAFAFLFAVPIGILCGLAAKQARRGRILANPEHPIPFRPMLLQIGIIICICVGFAIYKGTFSFVALGLVVVLLFATGLIGYVTYLLLMRAKPIHSYGSGNAPARTDESNAQQTGLKIAAWIHRNPTAGKLIFWAICAVGAVLFVQMILDILSSKKWGSAALIFAVMGWTAWSIAKDRKTGK